MNIEVPLSEYRFDIYENNHPMLLDVMNSKPGELAEWETFLVGWKEALAKENSTHKGSSYGTGISCHNSII